MGEGDQIMERGILILHLGCVMVEFCSSLVAEQNGEVLFFPMFLGFAGSHM